jgi:hypoxanthine phosphoribosyltransferase
MRAAPPSPHGEIGDVYLQRHEVTARVREIGAEIAAAYDSRDLVLVSPLHPDAPFLAELSRALGIRHTVADVAIAGYSRGGNECVHLLKAIGVPLTGRHVLAVADVIDTGLTVHFLCRTLEEALPASLAVVALLDRPCRRLVESIPLRWTGFTVPDELFAGYGLGFDECWQGLQDLHVVLGRQLSDMARNAA